MQWEEDGITYKKLAIFLAFMQRETLPEVADATGLSVVSVHRALHSLESALGCTLFGRRGRQLVPLDIAHQFVPYAQRSLAECQRGVQRVRDLAGLATPRLRIGCIYSLTLHSIPKLIIGLKLREPKLEISLTTGSNRDLMRDLAQGSVDAIVVGMNDDAPLPGLITVPLFQDELYFAVSGKSPLAKVKKIDLVDLHEQPFVGLTDGFVTSDGFRRAFKRAGFEPKMALEVADVFSLINLVGQGIGCSLLPGRMRGFNPSVRLVPLAPRYRTTQTIALLLPAAREYEWTLRALVAECRMYGERDGLGQG